MQPVEVAATRPVVLGYGFLGVSSGRRNQQTGGAAANGSSEVGISDIVRRGWGAGQAVGVSASTQEYASTIVRSRYEQRKSPIRYVTVALLRSRRRNTRLSVVS